jgi:cell division protein FtsQ
VALCVCVGALWAAARVEQFVVEDKRFRLEEPEPGVPSSSFRIEGVTNASELRIMDVFARDFGRSVYLCPIEERRRRLLAVNWVKDATVSRIWPNQIVVRITERSPVAFVQIPGPKGGMLHSAVDEDGVLLEPKNAAKLALPVISGVPADSEPRRRDRVRRFLRLQAELGAYMDQVSEIDVSDPDNLKIVQEFDGCALMLMVGNQNYLERYRNFINRHADIRSRLPGTTVFDLRLKDRITAVASGGCATGTQPESSTESRTRMESRK